MENSVIPENNDLNNSEFKKENNVTISKEEISKSNLKGQRKPYVMTDARKEGLKKANEQRAFNKKYRDQLSEKYNESIKEFEQVYEKQLKRLQSKEEENIPQVIETKSIVEEEKNEKPIKLKRNNETKEVKEKNKKKKRHEVESSSSSEEVSTEEISENESSDESDSENESNSSSDENESKRKSHHKKNSKKVKFTKKHKTNKQNIQEIPQGRTYMTSGQYNSRTSYMPNQYMKTRLV